MTDTPYIVFDMDGVLIDSERVVLNSWITCGPKYGVQNPGDFCRSCMGTTPGETRQRLFDAYGSDFAYEDFMADCRKYFYDEFDRTGTPIKAHVREAITGLHALGCTLAVASSTKEAIVRKQLGDVGILPYFSVVIGGDQLSRSKPEPDIYLLACKTLGVDPHKAYAVEDSHNGIRAAHRAGMMPIMIPDQQPVTEEMTRLCCEIFSDAEELLAYIRAQITAK